MSKFSMDDYVDVAERIRQFYAQHPEGSLKSGSPPQIIEAGGKPFIAYHAQAFRFPEDPVPTDGWAWEPVPGPTQFTKDSELMNAETAAWGRAIVALGFETKKLASRQEVRSRSGAEPVPAGSPDRGEQALLSRESAPDTITAAQLAQIGELVRALAELQDTTPAKLAATLKAEYGASTSLTVEKANVLIGKLARLKANLERSAGEPRGDNAAVASDAATGEPNGAPSPAEQSPFRAPTEPRGSKARAA